MSGNTIIFYMKTGTRELRVYMKNDCSRSTQITTVSDSLSQNRVGGISRPLTASQRQAALLNRI